ncbi:MAG: hypothetical protein L0332_05520 [Chloroflexi bacterium]|nr:hypothetical protein [Chloroflexota bacterium]MCI0576865.1 hypothetical protein [Chloroflexota bacterium]MCI0646481.1 hypothetical protein [Chloroflexota bacterium]MCI0726167.1 hypothetical protein [Chloroflexota bacterium]
MPVYNGLIRWSGVLSLFSGVTAVPLMVALALTGWGEPGTAAYQTYETLNRLMIISLLLMAAGWIGLLLLWPGGYGREGALLALSGAILMVIGHAAEFWLFSGQPYGATGNLGNGAWVAFSLGSPVMSLGATVAGLAIWRSSLWARWSGLLLLLALPLDLVAFFTVSPSLSPAVMALALGWLLVPQNGRPTIMSGATT